MKVAKDFQAQGPNRRRSTEGAPQQLTGDACKEAISFLLHCNDDKSVIEKMRKTFKYRQELIHDSQRTEAVFKIFPRFLDVKGLVSCSIDKNMFLNMDRLKQLAVE